MTPPYGRPTLWIGGILLPVLVSLYGAGCILTQYILITYRTGVVSYTGDSAAAIGVGLIAIAGIIHCQLFWDGIFGSTRAGARSKMFCLFVLAGSVLYVCYNLGPPPMF